ncbi:hypothetical protein Q1695_002878 [Nippostrongylus brasiliensis]|nr:hypothetical protein Q1695_002878 [Nippostrongylus brasiliensis]
MELRKLSCIKSPTYSTIMLLPYLTSFSTEISNRNYEAFYFHLHPSRCHFTVHLNREHPGNDDEIGGLTCIMETSFGCRTNSYFSGFRISRID